MKKLKFRIWDKQRNCFTTSIEHKYCTRYLSIGLLGGLEAHDEYGDEIDIDENDFVIQQFTGMIDKNGKDIFEGDILKFVNGKLSKVVFMCGGFCVVGFDGHLASDYLWEWTESYEVIGNIFENPELLK